MQLCHQESQRCVADAVGDQEKVVTVHVAETGERPELVESLLDQKGNPVDGVALDDHGRLWLLAKTNLTGTDWGKAVHIMRRQSSASVDSVMETRKAEVAAREATENSLAMHLGLQFITMDPNNPANLADYEQWLASVLRFSESRNAIMATTSTNMAPATRQSVWEKKSQSLLRVGLLVGQQLGEDPAESDTDISTEIVNGITMLKCPLGIPADTLYRFIKRGEDGGLAAAIWAANTHMQQTRTDDAVAAARHACRIDKLSYDNSLCGQDVQNLCRHLARQVRNIFAAHAGCL